MSHSFWVRVLNSLFGTMVATKIITDKPYVLEVLRAKVNMIVYKNNDKYWIIPSLPFSNILMDAMNLDTLK